MATKCLALLIEFRLKFRFKSLKRSFITTQQFTVHGVVCDIQWEGFDIRDINERMLFVLEVTRQETLLLESFPLGQSICKLEREIKI
jgi:hypothetical protein